MGRLSAEVLNQYQLIGTPNVCYFCSEPAYQFDLTPSQSAADGALATFPEAWIRAPACNKCWKRIYTANVANGGSAYGVFRGCMTLEHKRTLIDKLDTRVNIVGRRFTEFKSLSLFAPEDALYADEVFRMPYGSFSLDEVIGLQGTIIMIVMKRPAPHARLAFGSFLNSKVAVVGKQALYEMFTGIRDYKVHNDVPTE